MALVQEKRAANTLSEILTSWKALGDDGTRPRAAPSFMVPAEEIIASGPWDLSLDSCEPVAIARRLDRLAACSDELACVALDEPSLAADDRAEPIATQVSAAAVRKLLRLTIESRALTPAAQIQTWSPVLTSPS